MLYLIEILHQTTTDGAAGMEFYELYLIEILHQTTTIWWIETYSPLLYLIEILHQTTTKGKRIFEGDSCILLKFYIKPQRSMSCLTVVTRCILLKFYIKPQQKQVC